MPKMQMRIDDCMETEQLESDNRALQNRVTRNG